MEMNLKGTQSEKNLRAALMGESLARNKYTYYALKASEEGHPEIAELFETMARNESYHAKVWYQQLYGEIKDSKENLKEAASGEYSEWKDMYPSFAKTAREEGLEDLALLFERVADIEKSHEETFLKAFIALSDKKEGVVTPTEDKVKTVVNGYRCQFCGATFEERPDVCNVCKAIGSFSNAKIEK